MPDNWKYYRHHYSSVFFSLTIKEALIITNGNYYWLNFVLLFLSSCFNTLIIINFWSSFDERIIAEFISNIIIKKQKNI